MYVAGGKEDDEVFVASPDGKILAKMEGFVHPHGGSIDWRA